MKLNNKGFAISTIMYIILVLAVVLISLALTSLGNRKLILDKLKNEVIDEIYDDAICIAVSNSLTGNVAENDTNGNRIYKLGDEYLCEVKEGVKPTLKATTTDSIFVIDKAKVEEFIREKAKLGSDQKIYKIKDQL